MPNQRFSSYIVVTAILLLATLPTPVKAQLSGQFAGTFENPISMPSDRPFEGAGTSHIIVHRSGGTASTRGEIQFTSVPFTAQFSDSPRSDPFTIGSLSLRSTSFGGSTATFDLRLALEGMLLPFSDETDPPLLDLPMTLLTPRNPDGSFIFFKSTLGNLVAFTPEINTPITAVNTDPIFFTDGSDSVYSLEVLGFSQSSIGGTLDISTLVDQKKLGPTQPGREIYNTFVNGNPASEVDVIARATRTQVVHLAFGERTTWGYSLEHPYFAKIREGLGISCNVEKIACASVDKHSSLAPWHLSTTQQERILENMTRIFDEAGIGNLIFTTEDPGEFEHTTLYFSDLPTNVETAFIEAAKGGQPTLGHAPKEINGWDAFNTNLDGHGVVFGDLVDGVIAGRPHLSFDKTIALAEIAAHELGHLLGLSHSGFGNGNSGDIMDIDLTTADSFPKFNDSPSPIHNTDFTQNPTRHMERYVDGTSSEETDEAGLSPGNLSKRFYGVEFGTGSDTVLYDIQGVTTDGGFGGILSFDPGLSLGTMTIGDFSSFSTFETDPFFIVAASVPGGELDTFLSTTLAPDGFSSLALGTAEMQDIYVLTIQSDGSLITVATGIMSINVVPEPSSFSLTCIAILITGIRFRSACYSRNTTNRQSPLT